MKVWAIAMMKNEADIIRYSLAHMMAQGVDGIIIEDRGSTDGTAVTAEETALIVNPQLPVIVRREKNTGYFQPEVMTRLAKLAGERGAEWIIPWDIDELWTAASGTVAGALRRAEGSVVHIRQFYYYSTVLDDRREPNPFKRMRWRTSDFRPWSKCAFRYYPGVRVGHGAHSVSLPVTVDLNYEPTNDIVIHHFPVRSFDQMVSKVRTTAESFDLEYPNDPSWAGQGPSIHYLWNLYRRGGIEALKAVWESGDPATDHAGYVCVRQPVNFGLVEDPAPYKGAL